MKASSARHVLAYSLLLVVAIAGTAQALPGRNTVDSGDIKNGQVKSVDVGANTLTGADINETSLGVVPNAAKVGGLGTARFTVDNTSTSETAPTKAAAVGGLEIWVGCNEDPDPIDHYAWIEARSTVNGAMLTVSVAGSAPTHDPAFDSGDSVTITFTGFSPGHADVVFSTPAGSVVSADLAWAGIDLNQCSAHGVLLGG